MHNRFYTKTCMEETVNVTDRAIQKSDLRTKMSVVNYQCVMCGWPFSWPCGDTSALGETLYNIEAVYNNLNKEALPGLFHLPHDSHLVHQHSRKGIELACRLRNKKRYYDLTTNQEKNKKVKRMKAQHSKIREKNTSSG